MEYTSHHRTWTHRCYTCHPELQW